MYAHHTVVVGLGETGFSCVEYLVKEKVPIVVVDTRRTPPALAKLKKAYPEVPVFTGGWPKECLANASRVVLSPGISKTHPDIVQALSKDTEIIGDIELFARSLKHTPVIAITGSNGKSTVTSLVGHMAERAGIRVAVGGNLGVPVLALRTRFQETHHASPELYVLELSSFQLETTDTLKPLVSTILNICPDHLDRYATLLEYCKAKQRIFQNAERVVINRDDARSCMGLPENIPKSSFGLEPGFTFGLTLQNDQYWLARGNLPLMPVSQLNIVGQHNMANALAALALGEEASFPMEAMLEALRTFRGLPHRGEWVKHKDGIMWVNDSKGTNVGATIATLKGFSTAIPGKWVLIAGGEGKNADFRPLQSVVAKYCRSVILIGKEPKTLEELSTLFREVVPFQYANSMEEAVWLAAKHAILGDGVLLSPACASFDMFKNFEERGEAFKHACRS